MTEEQIWHGDPRMFRAYLTKWELQKTYDNEQAWRQGIYNMQGLSVILGGMFSQKGSKEITYFEKPLKEFDYIVEDEKVKNNNEDYKDMKVKQQYNYWAKFKEKARKKSKQGGV